MANKYVERPRDAKDDMTDRLLADLGIKEGMRVLDVGCGRGDVTMLLSRLVGSQGHVVAFDRDTRSLDIVKQRLHDQNIENVSVIEGDVASSSTLLQTSSFDIVVGRRVLMYVPQQVDAVRQLAQVLKPGGIIAFQEVDATMTPAWRDKPLTLHAQLYRWVWKMVESEGANLHTGFDLPSIFQQAGLFLVNVRAEAVVETAHTSALPLAWTIRAVLPRILQHKVATETEIDIDTLESRLTEERQKANTTFVSEMVFSAWARKPS